MKKTVKKVAKKKVIASGAPEKRKRIYKAPDKNKARNLITRG